VIDIGDGSLIHSMTVCFTVKEDEEFMILVPFNSKEYTA
jgi:hypothetical protein